MKTLNREKQGIAIIFLVSIFVMLLVSCKELGSVKISTSKLNDYSTLDITNGNGADITFAPVSSDIGSIGFKSGNELIWLTGKPVITKGEESTKYLWEIKNSDQVEMLVTKAVEGLEFKLKLISKDGGSGPEKWFLNTKATADEFFTGAMERVVDGSQNNSWAKGIETAMNLRNEIVEMKVKSTVAAYAPFYISSNNYGFFVHGTWPGIFDFCKTNPDFVGISFEGSELSFKVYLGAPRQIVQQHALETGPSFMAPKWAFGPWRWRDEHHNKLTYFDGTAVKAPYNSDIVEEILMMQAYDIPCTAYWIDRPWGVGSFGYDDFIIDSVRLPKFREMIKWLNGKNTEVMLWICPWAYGEMADVAREKEYYLAAKPFKGPRGGMSGLTDFSQIRGAGQGVPQARLQEPSVVMDFTNPEAAKWWGENGPAKLAAMGVRGFKLDRGDGERENDSVGLKTFSGISYRGNYNDYSRQFVQATYDAVKPILGDNFLLFPRAQYTGSSRYGVMWAGDTYSSAEGLRSVIIAMQRCAVMGYPLWTSDGCGYTGTIDPEVAKRWIGFECFSPMMEIGPTNDKGFWNLYSDTVTNNEMLAVWRFYAKLRMSLVDYTFDLSQKANETGMPVARPLFLEYPEQKESWNDWKTYKLGDDLLISVIWEKGVTKQQVYLPSGETWIDMWNKTEYKGGQYVEVEAQPYQTPVFLRKGSSLALPDFNKLYEESKAITSVKQDLKSLEINEIWQ